MAKDINLLSHPPSVSCLSRNSQQQPLQPSFLFPIVSFSSSLLLFSDPTTHLISHTPHRNRTTATRRVSKRRSGYDHHNHSIPPSHLLAVYYFWLCLPVAPLPLPSPFLRRRLSCIHAGRAFAYIKRRETLVERDLHRLILSSVFDTTSSCSPSRSSSWLRPLWLWPVRWHASRRLLVRLSCLSTSVPVSSLVQHIT